MIRETSPNFRKKKDEQNGLHGSDGPELLVRVQLRGDVLPLGYENLDDKELDERILLLRDLYDPDIWRAALHVHAAKVRASGHALPLEHASRDILNHRIHQDRSGADTRSEELRTQAQHLYT